MFRQQGHAGRHVVHGVGPGACLAIIDGGEGDEYELRMLMVLALQFQASAALCLAMKAPIGVT